MGLVLAQSPEFVAPHGAKQPIFGTNPIALSVPAFALEESHHAHGNGNGAPLSHTNGTAAAAKPHCVTMDMATAAYAWFGLLEARTAGRSIPGDVALNAKGEPTTDPNEVRGALHVMRQGGFLEVHVGWRMPPPACSLDAQVALASGDWRASRDCSLVCPCINRDSTPNPRRC